MSTKHTPLPFIRKLLANTSEREVKEAEERFLDFLDIAQRIHARMKTDEEP